MLLTDEKSKSESKSTLKDDIEKEWRLVLHDDDVHEIEEVTNFIIQVQWL